jgi:hypothetical protein
LTRIHKGVTAKTPEQVLKNFINEISGERVVLSLKRKYPVQLIAAAAFIVVSAIFLSFMVFSKMKQSSENVMAPEMLSDTIITADSLLKTQVDSHENSGILQRKTILYDVSKQGTLISGKESSGAAKIEHILSENRNGPKQNIAISLLDSLRISYATDDLNLIVERELESKRYQHVLLLYDTIVSKGPAESRVIMCKLRALRYLNDRAGISKLLSENNVPDGEFLLEKARIEFNEDDTASALELLKECNRTPAAFIDGKQFRLEYLYLTAKCKSKQFDQIMDAEHKSQALDAWFDVKAELQTSQDHGYFKEAENEMQRITSKVIISQR